MGRAVKPFQKNLLLTILTLLALAGTVWLASGDRLRHYPSNRVLNQSAISALKPTDPVNAGFELRQRIDTTKINDAHPELHDLPVCIQVFVDAAGTSGQGTLQFELSSGGRSASSTLHSSQVPSTFQRICFPQSSLRMLLGAQDASLRISVLEPDARNVAGIVLTPLSTGQEPAEINGQTSDLFLPHMIEVQRPPSRASWVKVLAMLAFATTALLIIFAGSARARRASGLTQASQR